jgi:hypothetical protein
VNFDNAKAKREYHRGRFVKEHEDFAVSIFGAFRKRNTKPFLEEFFESPLNSYG